ncbi:hypothetical protein M1N23_02860 [Dehalococcoidia bacterium]|nr:hypothetical protein [Dehalococcoidia bacterium]
MNEIRVVRQEISEMRKYKIVIPIAIAMVAVAVVSFSVALAQGNGEGDSNASKLAIKVAEILGLDTTEVNDAIKQARKELRDEATTKRINALVEKGRLTQEQADKYLNWIQSRPADIPSIGKHSFMERGPHRGWKGHKRPFGPRNHFKGKFSLQNVQDKLNAMVDDGVITQAEADAKLKGIQAK